MKYDDLRDFIAQLEKLGELKRIFVEVDPHLEMTEICDRVLRAGGPALLFEKPKGSSIPVLANLFGTPRRVALGMGEEGDWQTALREVGKLLAYLKEPEPPRGLKDAWDKLPVLKQVLNMAPKVVSSAPCQDVVWEGQDVDLARLPVQTCWPGDAGPLITWGLVVTRGPHKPRQNLGIYRQQVIAPNKVIMRWLAHRGGALDFLEEGPSRPALPRGGRDALLRPVPGPAGGHRPPSRLQPVLWRWPAAGRPDRPLPLQPDPSSGPGRLLPCLPPQQLVRRCGLRRPHRRTQPAASFADAVPGWLRLLNSKSMAPLNHHGKYPGDAGAFLALVGRGGDISGAAWYRERVSGIRNPVPLRGDRQLNLDARRHP
ncbi:protein of unknown function [Denitratisoma oestradiolicum]|uniref:3-octaprenyl-4-hydroxybenzoate decarboxylase n=1 Tax=Denitratisoma oestradiolicum TaxID=311182 RepID=A0A6S6XU97_9PROT|nr:protein of unknown function [Denitratisoma oestradiolicum]